MRNPWCEMFQAYAPASPNATRSPTRSARSRPTRTRRALSVSVPAVSMALTGRGRRCRTLDACRSPDACRTPETGNSLRQNALDPGFHGAPTRPGTPWIRRFMAFHRAPPARSALAPDDPADVLVGGDDPPARRGVRPARLGRLSGRPPRLDHGRAGGQGLSARRELLQLGPGDLERLRHRQHPAQRGGEGDLVTGAHLAGLHQRDRFLV